MCINIINIMEEIRNRLTQIREAKKLNKTEFAKPLNLDRSTISRMENGSAPITDRNIMVICKIYNVNELWLREGQGDMFKTYSQGNSFDKYKENFFEIFDQLSPESCSLLIKIAEDILESQKRLLGKANTLAVEPEPTGKKRDTILEAAAEKETHPIHDRNRA